MPNKPGIPNEGDTVKIIEVSELDAYYEDEQWKGISGVVANVEQYGEWLCLRLVEVKGWTDTKTTFYEAKVKILKRKK